MGVRTKTFGRFIWIVLETLAVVFDQIMKTEKDKVRKDLVLCKMREILCLLGFVLPCIYCRQSYINFTDADVEGNEDTDVEKFLSLRDGAKKLIYNLHNRVSSKLRDQELADPEKKGQEKKIRKYWKSHMISYEEALQKQFVQADSYRFWNAMFASMSLIMCDWRPDECSHTLKFMVSIGELLLLSRDVHVLKTGVIYMGELKETLPEWKRDADLETRLDIIMSVFKPIYDYNNWEMAHDTKSLLEKCQKDAFSNCSKA